MTFVNWLALALLCAFSLTGARAEDITAGGQRLEGAWTVRLTTESSSDPSIAVSSAEVMAAFAGDGVMFIDNVVPDPPGLRTKDGKGEWVRSGNRQFDLTWRYVIAATADGSSVGAFVDRARLVLSADGTQISGVYTFEARLTDGSVPLKGRGRITGTRIAVSAPE